MSLRLVTVESMPVDLAEQSARATWSPNRLVKRSAPAHFLGPRADKFARALEPESNFWVKHSLAYWRGMFRVHLDPVERHLDVGQTRGNSKVPDTIAHRRGCTIIVRNHVWGCRTANVLTRRAVARSARPDEALRGFFDGGMPHSPS